MPNTVDCIKPTYGGIDEPNKLETRVLINSPKVATYDLQPEMSAPAVCEEPAADLRGAGFLRDPVRAGAAQAFKGACHSLCHPPG